MRKPGFSRHARYRGTSARHREAARLLQHVGDFTLVHRGHARSIVMVCPDGCGEVITINLDEEAGPAWRLYKTRRGITLYPSIWRDSGCRSHFILWNNAILWFDGHDASGDEITRDLEVQVLRQLKIDQFTSYVTIADKLQEIPWTVLWACQNLVAQRLGERGTGEWRDWFRRTKGPVTKEKADEPIARLSR